MLILFIFFILSEKYEDLLKPNESQPRHSDLRIVMKKVTVLFDEMTLKTFAIITTLSFYFGRDKM